MAVSRIRNLESALQETREELLRAEEEAAQLRRDLDESREERRLDGASARGDASARGGGDEGDGDAEITNSARGQFYTDEEIAAQEEENTLSSPS